ncbi:MULTISPECIES: sulfite exporter TauE/SafE family protein [Nostoc]|uniref:Probable membrane transporter protein n=2 Tax=Nostoc TaxID=1177 RepID=A0ABR8HZB6_9NOSO|nr:MULTISPECIES: sulfite exporter TauE/SafE family protein [Nostoc]MBD2560892.1 sulfite exporter TauE/SafE family protein [Nostoc linckia FACHB-391]MBD2644693.1 sulfite exporter TauE/SafE family protein [Nostoc foliaceum FACHB-393]
MKKNNSSAPEPTTTSLEVRRFRLSFLYAVPIGLLGGLIGLGGAEFRLPVLAGTLGYSVRQAVPLNLAVSLITIAASLVIRGSTLSFSPVIPLLPVIFSLIAGAVTTAFFGVAVAGKLSNEQLERIILVLLVVIGIALIVEGFLPQQIPALLPPAFSWRILAGILFGLAIGLVSNLLGVAGGEVIIPTLVFAFGADIKTAGTASLLVSLPTVLVGVIKYANRGAFVDRTALSNTIAPMGVGSVIGAIIGGMLVGIFPASALKITLGVILNISAFRVFHKAKSSNEKPES